jgi:sulfide:quinone oxidoreductase
MANILIIGGGFGGLIAAENLSSELGSEHQITLVSDSQKFVFYPALVQVALGRLEPEDVSFDLRKKAGKIGVRFVEGEVVGIDVQRRSVEIAGDDFAGDIHYDYLVLALGRRLATEKAPGFYEYAHHLLDVRSALKFGAAVKDFRAGRIVVGMCPGADLPVPACETAFALAQRFESEMLEDKISISLVFPESVDEAFGGAEIFRQLEWAFMKHDIGVVKKFPVREITEHKIFDDTQRSINYDLLMLVPPFQGHGIIKHLEIGDESGFVEVNECMQAVGLPKTYAVGDCTALPGPKLAHMAVRQAAVAAKNIASEIRGELPKEAYYHEINSVIDAGGADSIHLHYGIWDDDLYRLQKGRLWSWAKNLYDSYWLAKHF